MKTGRRDYSFEFEGVGFIVKGRAIAKDGQIKKDNENPEIEVWVDGVSIEKAILPTDFTRRRHEICWKYNLSRKTHNVKIQLLNPEKGYEVWLDRILIYTDSQ